MKPTGKSIGTDFAAWLRAQNPQTPEEKEAFLVELRRRKAEFDETLTPEIKKAMLEHARANRR